MSGPSLTLGLPPRSLFKFPPDNEPPALPPPVANALNPWAAPFGINAELFNAALHPAVPLTIGLVYATTVTYLNAYNRKHENRAWPISKTPAFHAFVVAHNVFLAVYSAITCFAMGRAMYASLSGATDGVGFVGAVDALCQIQGPRGLGDAVSYSPVSNTWASKNKNILLSSVGTPDYTDAGRIWNEGLAFWGWWFYLSKFYEVMDTVIILLKGKRSTTLQKYHHTGAMLAMWAGIRYMSPPIWMFVQINSGIHAMMYTYYTVSALGYRVPNAIKRSLTTMQILQFLIGASFASMHLFVYYSVPVSTPFQVAKTIKLVASAASSAVSSAASDVAATATASASLGGMWKRLAMRAAGEEALAENMGERPRHFVQEQIPAKLNEVKDAVSYETSYETRYRNQYEWVQCIDTTGQSFAIWLNVIYLFPLTILFSRFFYKSYLKRSSTGSKTSTKAHNTKAAIEDAARGVNNKVEKTGQKAENGVLKAEERVKSKAKFEKSLVPHQQDLEEIEDMKNRIGEGIKTALKQQTGKGNKKSTEEVKDEAKPKEEKKPNGTAANGHAANGSPKKAQKAKANGNVKKEDETNSLPSPPPSEAPTESGDQQTKGDVLKSDQPNGKPEDAAKDDEEIVKDGEDEGKDEAEDEEHGSSGAGLLSTTDPREEDQTYAEVVKEGE